MTDSTTRFSNRVENYVRYRPNYPAAVIELLRTECKLNQDSVVADIGSGTGIFTRLLLETGCHVYGVEPNAPMREAAEKLLSGFEKFTSVDTPAEATTLPDKSVDFVTCAQAFHWFDREKCRVEFRRILRDHGFVVLLWNERLVDTTPFLRDYETLLLNYATDYEQVNHTQIDDAVLYDFFEPDGYEKHTFSNHQLFNYEGLKGRLLSSSYAPPENHANYKLMLQHLREIFENHQKNGIVSFDYETNVYIGKLPPIRRDLNLES